MKVAIATESWPPYATDTSFYRHTRDVLAAVRLAGLDAYPLALSSNRGAKVGGLVRPYLRRHLGGYAEAGAGDLVHHVTQESRRGVDVVTVHDTYAFHDTRFSDRFFRDAVRLAIRRAKRVVFTTQWSLEEAARRPEFAGMREKFRVVPVPHRTPPAGRSEGPARFDAVWIGRNSPNKNLPLYLALAVRHPAHRFAVRSSKSPDREALDREVAWKLAAAQNVASLPRLSDDEMDALYRSTPVLVVTSNFEGFHDPAMEAYVRGAKVVLPRIEPYLELYRGGDAANTYWYEPEWVERPFAWDFGRSLERLSAAFGEAHAARAGLPDARVVRAVSLEAVGEGLRAVYEEVGGG